MTLQKLESQSHDSERVGESAKFIGFIWLTPANPIFDRFQPETRPTVRYGVLEIGVWASPASISYPA